MEGELEEIAPEMPPDEKSPEVTEVSIDVVGELGHPTTPVGKLKLTGTIFTTLPALREVYRN